MIIGLSGYAGAGKDTVADILVARYGYDKRAFADPIRKGLYAINPMIDTAVRLQDVVDEYGWQVAKGNPEVRRLLQVFGTEFAKEQFGKDVWVKLATESLNPEERVVFSDVRFREEAAAIIRLGGTVWRIDRKGVGPVNEHISESNMTGWKFDNILRNNFGKDELEAMVVSTMDWYDVYGNPSPLPA